MGKLMVAEGLGTTVLPDFSVRGDPLERSGLITYRPLEDDHTPVHLVIQRPLSASIPTAARALHDLFVKCAETCTKSAETYTRATSDQGVTPPAAGPPRTAEA